jgi:hypothetical protein
MHDIFCGVREVGHCWGMIVQLPEEARRPGLNTLLMTLAMDTAAGSGRYRAQGLYAPELERWGRRGGGAGIGSPRRHCG